MNDEQVLEKLRYPIGQWVRPEKFDFKKVAEQITTIGHFAEKIIAETSELSDEILDTPYRKDGWTVRQVVHHCADSHMNAFIRFKLALTENSPTVKTYQEQLWADLADGKLLPVNVSLQIIEALHVRWTVLMVSMNDEQWNRGFIHPEHKTELKLFQVVSLYAWHCEHHFGHIKLVTGKI